MKKLFFTLSLLLVLSLTAALVACPLIYKNLPDAYFYPLHSEVLPEQKSMSTQSCPFVVENFLNPAHPKTPVPDDEDPMTIFAGNDTIVCFTSDSILLNGQAINCHYFAWDKLGDGYFDNINSANTFYVPGSEDLASNSVVLFLTGVALQPHYIMIVDTLKITIIPNAQCFAGQNQCICEGDILTLEGQASNYSEISWSSSGDGSFDNLNILDANYFHGADDLADGNVLLSLQATSLSPCVQPATNTMQVFITYPPEGDAGNDTALCVNDVLQVNAEGFYFDEIIWFTNGNGDFSNPNILDPVYFPDSTDFEEGLVQLTMILTPENACINPFVDSILLLLHSPPEVNVGSDQTVCQGDAIICQATASGYSNLLWETLGGNGTFDDASLLNASYFPGAHEINQGYCFLYLTAQAIDPCLGIANGYFKLNIIPQLVASAGNDQNVCKTDAAQLTGEINSCSSFEWETLGDGTFANVNTLSPQYFAGNYDIDNSNALITLSAVAASPCAGSAIDTILLTYWAPASVFAGLNGLACATITLAANVENQAASLWISSGDGTFDNPSDPNTKYYAGSQDLANSVVTLHLYAGSNDPCSEMVADDVVYIIDRPVFIGQISPVEDVMVNQSINLAVEAASFSTLNYQWYFQGNAIENENSSVLTIDNADPGNAGNYYCLCANNCFTIQSDTCRVYVYETAEQTIEIENGWNAISSYLYLENVEVSAVLDPIISEVVILLSEEGVFWPGQDIQTFDNWNSDIGYMLKTESNENLTINGLIKYPSAPVLISQGWSVMPVKSTCEISVTEAFSNHPNITFIQEIGGIRLYWPEKGIYTLDSLSPGKAYHIYNAGSNDVLFTFPGCED